MNSDWKHLNFQYRLGLNIDDKPFSNEIYGPGLRYYTLKQVIKNITQGPFVAFISIPNEAKTMDNEDFCKADRIYIEKIINLSNWEMFDNEDFCLEALTYDTSYDSIIQYMKKQTQAICMKAVKRFGLDLQFVNDENKTEAVCLVAIREDGRHSNLLKIKLKRCV